MIKTQNNAQRDIKNIDWILLALTLVACVFGIIMISSAAENPFKYVVVQSVAMFLGIGLGVFIMVLDYEYLGKLMLYLLGASLFLLIIVLIPGIGKVENNARSWIRFGPIGFQPAELVKIFFIITFAKHLSEVDYQIDRPRNVIMLVVHMGLLIGLVLLQPDFGTAVVFFCIAIAMLFVAKIGWKYIIGGTVLAAAVFPPVWFFLLKEYQKNRIINLLNPENDPAGSGYQVMQSKIAAGSGRIFGSGLYKGSSQFNNFLPERHTDFIFSVVCEELGFIGAALVVLLLVGIIVRCLMIGYNARNNLGRYICVGVATMMAFHVFENVGMCIGLMPVTGIPLPFFSYGGSSLVTNIVAISLVMNVRYRSKVINF